MASDTLRLVLADDSVLDVAVMSLGAWMATTSRAALNLRQPSAI